MTVEVTVDVTGTEDPGEARIGGGTPNRMWYRSLMGTSRGRGVGPQVRLTPVPALRNTECRNKQITLERN